MAKISEAKIVIKGDSTSAVRAADNVERKYAQTSNRMDAFKTKVQSAMNNAGTYVTAFATTAAYALVNVIKSTIDTADQLSKLSRSIGISVEQLSTLSYAAEISGTNIDSLRTGLMRFARTVDEANQGKGEYVETIERMGLTLQNAQGELLSSDQLLMQVANRFAAMEDGVEKTALSMELFGRSGAALIPLLNGGASGIAALQEEARLLGLEIDTNTGVQAEQFNDSLRRLQGSAEGLVITLTSEILPTFNRVTTVVNDVSDAMRTNQTVIMGIGAMYGSLLAPIAAVISGFNAVYDVFADDDETIQTSIRSVHQLNQVMQSVNTTTSTTTKNLIQQAGAISEFTAALQYQGASMPFGEDPLVMQETADQRLEILNNAMLSEMEMRQQLTDYNIQEANRVTSAELSLLALREAATSNTMGNMAGAMQNFYQASGQQATAFFGMYKAFAIAQASIDTYQSAVAAYKSLAGIPLVGPFLGAAAAAAAIAFGVSQVARISAMQPGGRASGGASIPSVGTSTPNIQPPQQQTQGGREVVVNLTVTGSLPDKDAYAREILPGITKAIKDGVNL